MCRIDCDAESMRANCDIIPWYPFVASFEVMNRSEFDLLSIFMGDPSKYEKLERFQYFNIQAPNPDSIKGDSFKNFGKIPTLKSITLNFFESSEQNLLDRFFVNFQLPPGLEQLKLTINLS